MNEDLERIREGLERARGILRELAPGDLEVEEKPGAGPVTEADRRVDAALRELLPRAGEGWLSEETPDDLTRLERRRVWVVDPIDGTKELVRGVPEWCVSIGLVEEGRPVAGGILNPAADRLLIGAVGEGLWLDGCAVRATRTERLEGALVLASRTELRRGDWRRFEGSELAIRATGSVAYKLALVAAGLADATWTLSPKSEWDIAAGAALVAAAGGRVFLPAGGEPVFNRREPRVPGIVATCPGLAGAVSELLGPAIS